ncbi:nucleotidyl transferase AbiEii/AbiGii toxin family protein [Leptospira kmetyi]|nr:nucleotidyl transferase AbiEii/AbiGii toxin family protein [Leptospira kmetyi]
MITKDEIKDKSKEYNINPADVERDYVFGWILNGIYSESPLKDYLILKGGNLYRKAYLSNARFSKDLDFGFQTPLNSEFIIEELNQICENIAEKSGIDFDLNRNKVEYKQTFNNSEAYEARLYFKDFFGKPGRITISAKLDIAEMQRIFLPIQSRPLIHPYSDSSSCSAEVMCLKLEESLADKIKCLLQRRHIADLFDLIYSIFFNSTIPLDKAEIFGVFLQKTIFARNPKVVRDILLSLPLKKLNEAWNNYVIAPLISKFDFNDAISNFESLVRELFPETFSSRGDLAFFPPDKRNKIIDAGYNQKLLIINYEGYVREVEPYSLTYKIRQDGIGQEYFYGYDLTGGKSKSVSIKIFLHSKIRSIEISDKSFTPRFEIELSKAGEFGKRPYFPRTRRRFTFSKKRRPRRRK